MTVATINSETSRARVAGFIGNLSTKKRWRVEVKEARGRRTLNQNALYWKWVGIIASATGNSPKATHDALKDEFCPPSEVKLGSLTKMTHTTTALEIEAMSEYMNNVQAFAETELGLLLPIPEEMHRHD